MKVRIKAVALLVVLAVVLIMLGIVNAGHVREAPEASAAAAPVMINIAPSGEGET